MIYILKNNFKSNARLRTALGSAYKGSFQAKMTPTEASTILGVRMVSSKEEISKRHRELMKLNHPDQGGSSFICAKINEAKEVLTRDAYSSNKI